MMSDEQLSDDGCGVVTVVCGVMMKSTYFSDIPVRSVAEPGDVRKIGTRLESS